MTWKFPELEVDTGQFLAIVSDSCMEWIIQNISLGCYIPPNYQQVSQLWEFQAFSLVSFGSFVAVVFFFFFVSVKYKQSLS